MANAAKLTVTNCIIANVTSGDSHAAGLLLVDNNADVKAWNTTFTNLVGRGAVGLEQTSGTQTPKFTATGCRFLNNNSRVGTVYNYYGGHNNEPQGTITLTECLFDGNTASSLGVVWTHGASAVWTAAASGWLYVDRCVFRDNVGGRLFSLVRLTGRISNSLFMNNQASGGDMFVGWGYNVPLVNCTFVKNSGGYGEWGPSPSANLRNCIVAGDAKLNSGTASLLILSHVILWNTPLGTGYNEGSSTQVIAADPLFRHLPEPFDVAQLDARLSPSSPAVDAGNNTHVFGSTDLVGKVRILDGNFDKQATVDLGAYELERAPRGTYILIR